MALGEASILARNAGDNWLLGVTLLDLRRSVASGPTTTPAPEPCYAEALTTSAGTGGMILSAGLRRNVRRRSARPEASPQTTVRLLAAAATYRADTALPLRQPREQRRIDAGVAQARRALGPIRVAIQWAAGTDMTLSEAVDTVLAPVA